MERVIEPPSDQRQVKRLKRNRMFLAATIGGTAPMIALLFVGALMKSFPQLKGPFLPGILCLATMGFIGYLIKRSMQTPKTADKLDDYQQANKNLFRLALALLAALLLLFFC